MSHGLAEASARRRVLCMCCALLCGGLHLGDHPEAEDPEESPDDVSTDTNVSGRVLLFFAVGSSPSTMRLVMDNVRHARSRRDLPEVAVFLAHYDMNRSAWLKEDHLWYAENVNESVERPGYKFQLAKELLVQLGALSGYEWVWVLDEDVDIRGADLAGLVQDANAAGSLIVAPSVTHQVEPRMKRLHEITAQLLSRRREDASLFCQPGDQVCRISAPHHSCRWRYVNTVEVMVPLMRPAALQVIFDCQDCMGEESVWGLDLIWCSYVGRRLTPIGEEETACAILDRFPVLHTDARTLPKWDSEGRPLQSVIHKYFAERHLVKVSNPTDWLEPRKAATLSCVRHDFMKVGAPLEQEEVI